MSKDAWFAEFERLEAEHPELSDDKLSDLATKALADSMADAADQALDEAKYDD